MRTLNLTAERVAFLASLSIGASVNVKWCSARGDVDGPDQERVFTAEVIEQRPDEERPAEGETDVLVQLPTVAGGRVVTLMLSDAESLLMSFGESEGAGTTRVREVEGWFALDEEQPLHYDPPAAEVVDDDESGFMAGIEAGEAEFEAGKAIEVEAVAEDKPQPPAAPQAGTAVAPLNLPRGAAWLMNEAAMIDYEAAQYSKFNVAHHHLKAAASSLRSAVGFVLAGDPQS